MRALLALLVIVSLAACTPTPAKLPDGVEATVFQNRSDYSTRTLVIGIINRSDVAITLTDATYSSPAFVESMRWERGTTLRPGGQVDLRVPLAAVDCTMFDSTGTVTLGYVDANGAAGTASLDAVDIRERIPEIVAEDCIGESTATVAAVTVAPGLEWTPGAAAPATVRIDVQPVDATAGPLTLERVHQTVLLALVDDTGVRVESLPIDLTVRGGDAATSIRLGFEPSRCDPHAVAEDKRGTFFPLDVMVNDGAQGTIYLAADDDTRAQIYEYIADFCEFESVG
jgi:hypothetical protein